MYNKEPISKNNILNTIIIDQNNAEIIENHITISIKIQFNYLNINDIMRMIKETNSIILTQNIDNQCSMELSINKRDRTRILAKLETLNNGFIG